MSSREELMIAFGLLLTRSRQPSSQGLALASPSSSPSILPAIRKTQLQIRSYSHMMVTLNLTLDSLE